MIGKAKALVLFAVVLLLGISQVQSARIPTTTSIPTIPAVSAGVFYMCAPFVTLPGSATIGANGFVRVTCPQAGRGAITLDGILTPSFILSQGYVQAAIIFPGGGGTPCNFAFKTLQVGNVTVASGHFLNQTMSFSSNPVQGQMLTAAYDYCLQYTNAPSSGLAGFDVIWT
jgi:hypothetical protein